VTARAAPFAAGVAVLVLVFGASALAWRDGSPLVPRDGGLARNGTAWAFAVLLGAAFVAYVVGWALLRRAEVRLVPVLAVAVAIQLAPLASPLLLSTDAWTYWGYGWIAARTSGNPYADAPAAFPENPALPHVGAAWRDTTSVYGPAFTLLSEPVAKVAGSSPDTAAWLFKSIAAAGMLSAVVAVSRVSRRSALSVAFVGWNPVIAVHAAGGGHNDALVAGFVAVAAVLAARCRPSLSGGAWALGALVKWVPAVLFVLAALAERARGRRTGIGGAFAVAVVVGAVATWRYGLDWIGAAGPLVDNADRETSYALPSRLEQLGVAHWAALAFAAAGLVAGFAFLARAAARGHARLGRAACLILATTPYLAVWYLAWAVTLVAADDEDRVAGIAALALTAYLLPQTIPL
jgi:alpha-1,6-mannosyltransferase